MISFLFEANFLPFSLALGLLFGLLALELISLFLGGSLVFDQDPDLDAGLDTGLDFGGEIPTPGAFDFDFGAQPDLGELINLDQAATANPSSAADSGILSAIGLKGVPLLVWAAAFLAGFGLSGILLQSQLSVWLGFAIAWPVISLIALPIGIMCARFVSKQFKRIFASNESSALAVASLGGLKGKVTQGTAKHLAPAEVTVRDWNGNYHFLRCEPFDPDAKIAEGTNIITIRERVPLEQREAEGKAFHIRIMDISDHLNQVRSDAAAGTL